MISIQKTSSKDAPMPLQNRPANNQHTPSHIQRQPQHEEQQFHTFYNVAQVTHGNSGDHNVGIGGCRAGLYELGNYIPLWHTILLQQTGALISSNAVSGPSSVTPNSKAKRPQHAIPIINPRTRQEIVIEPSPDAQLKKTGASDSEPTTATEKKKKNRKRDNKEAKQKKKLIKSNKASTQKEEHSSANGETATGSDHKVLEPKNEDNTSKKKKNRKRDNKEAKQKKKLASTQKEEHSSANAETAAGSDHKVLEPKNEDNTSKKKKNRKRDNKEAKQKKKLASTQKEEHSSANTETAAGSDHKVLEPKNEDNTSKKKKNRKRDNKEAKQKKKLASTQKEEHSSANTETAAGSDLKVLEPKKEDNTAKKKKNRKRDNKEAKQKKKLASTQKEEHSSANTETAAGSDHKVLEPKNEDNTSKKKTYRKGDTKEAKQKKKLIKSNKDSTQKEEHISANAETAVGSDHKVLEPKNEDNTSNDLKKRETKITLVRYTLLDEPQQEEPKPALIRYTLVELKALATSSESLKTPVAFYQNINCFAFGPKNRKNHSNEPKIEEPEPTLNHYTLLDEPQQEEPKPTLIRYTLVELNALATSSESLKTPVAFYQNINCFAFGPKNRKNHSNEPKIEEPEPTLNHYTLLDEPQQEEPKPTLIRYTLVELKALATSSESLKTPVAFYQNIKCFALGPKNEEDHSNEPKIDEPKLKEPEPTLNHYTLLDEPQQEEPKPTLIRYTLVELKALATSSESLKTPLAFYQNIKCFALGPKNRKNHSYEPKKEEPKPTLIGSTLAEKNALATSSESLKTPVAFYQNIKCFALRPKNEEDHSNEPKIDEPKLKEPEPTLNHYTLLDEPQQEEPKPTLIRYTLVELKALATSSESLKTPLAFYQNIKCFALGPKNRKNHSYEPKKEEPKPTLIGSTLAEINALATSSESLKTPVAFYQNIKCFALRPKNEENHSNEPKIDEPKIEEPKPTLIRYTLLDEPQQEEPKPTLIRYTLVELKALATSSESLKTPVAFYQNSSCFVALRPDLPYLPKNDKSADFCEIL